MSLLFLGSESESGDAIRPCLGRGRKLSAGPVEHDPQAPGSHERHDQPKSLDGRSQRTGGGNGMLQARSRCLLCRLPKDLAVEIQFPHRLFEERREDSDLLAALFADCVREACDEQRVHQSAARGDLERRAAA